MHERMEWPGEDVVERVATPAVRPVLPQVPVRVLSQEEFAFELHRDCLSIKGMLYTVAYNQMLSMQ